MKKLEAVEEARAIMTPGMEWGVFKWLHGKTQSAQIADRATEALNEAEDRVKATWSDELKRAYNYLATQDGEAGKGKKGAKGKAEDFDPEVLAIARKSSMRTRRRKPCGWRPKIPSPKASAIERRHGARRCPQGAGDLRLAREGNSQGGGGGEEKQLAASD